MPRMFRYDNVMTPTDLPDSVTFVQADLATKEGVEQVIQAVKDQLASIDIIVHCVGGSTTPPGGALVLSDDDWLQALNWNLLAAVRLDRGLIPLMLLLKLRSLITAKGYQINFLH